MVEAIPGCEDGSSEGWSKRSAPTISVVSQVKNNGTFFERQQKKTCSSCSGLYCNYLRLLDLFSPFPSALRLQAGVLRGFTFVKGHVFLSISCAHLKGLALTNFHTSNPKYGTFIKPEVVKTVHLENSTFESPRLGIV